MNSPLPNRGRSVGSTNPIGVFVSYISAFGGVERLIVSLSHYLHNRGLDHTIVCFEQTIDFSAYADWPMRVLELKPARNAISEARALNVYLRRAGQGPAPLLFDLKSAFYAGLFRCPDFNLHLTDPPSLLPADVSKYAPSLRGAFSRNVPTVPASLLLKIRGEAVHQFNRRGVRRARTLITMANANADELRALYGREAKVVRQGVSLPSVRPRLQGRRLKPCCRWR